MKLPWQRMRESTAAASAGPLLREDDGDSVTCPTCDGDGKIMSGKRSCPDCGGTGKVTTDSDALKEALIALSADAVGLMSDDTVARLREAGSLERNADERKDMAKSGAAMPDGSYPIGNADELGAAIKAVGRGGADHNDIRKHIIKRAKTLGASAQVPDNWASDGSLKDSFDALHLRVVALESEIGPLRQLRESKPSQLNATFSTPTRVKTTDGQEGYKVILIREGMGNSEDNRWYPGSAIREMCESGVADGMQAYADHPDLEEEQIRPERSVRQLVGHYRDVRFAESGGVPRAEAVFVPMTLDEAHPTYGWVVTLAEAASNVTAPQPLCGISLYGYSAGDYGTRPDMSEGMIATLIRPTSGDIVTNAGAGGGFVRRLMESARQARLHNTTRKEQPMLAATFKDKLAEATTRLREATTDEGRTAALADIDALNAQTIDAPAAPVASLEALTESAPAVVAQLREAVKAESGEEVEQLRERLTKAEKFITGITDVRSLAESLAAAGVTDETELKYYIGQAQGRGLREAADIKDMVDTDRAFHAKQQETLETKVREATADLDIEGVWGRVPDGTGSSTEDSVAALRESGIPTVKPEKAASAA